MSVFYCYSIKLKDFLKSRGFKYINKSVNHSSGKPYFTFQKSDELTKAILLWNEIKFKN